MGNYHSRCNCLDKYGKIITLYNNQMCKRLVIINEITGESYDIRVFYEHCPFSEKKVQTIQINEYFYLTLEILLSFEIKHIDEIFNLKFEKSLNYITTLLLYKKLKGFYPTKTIETKFDGYRVRAFEYTFFYLKF